MRAIVIATFVSVGCSSAEQQPAPTLEITSPERGTIANTGQITVAGHALHASRVTVNGTDVPAGVDGTFSTTIDVGTGIGIIETHAISGSDDVRDVRAVLAGPTAPTDGKLKAPLGAYASLAALKDIGSAMATEAKGIDYTAAVQPLNPVYNNTGCLGAKIDITSVALGAVDVGIAPSGTALATDVTIHDVVVKLHADYKVACIGGSTTITVTSSAAHLHGSLGAGVTSGAIKTSIGSVTVALDAFAIDVGGVPSAIESLFDSTVRGKVESALTGVIHDKVPAIADHALAGLVAKPLKASILNYPTTITATPTAASVSATGLFVTVDTTVVVSGADAMALSRPMPMTAALLADSKGVGLALSADAINQLLAGLWDVGAFDQNLPIASVGALAAILDSHATTLKVTLSLPPTVTTSDAGLELALGDVIVTTRDAQDLQVQQLALSAKTTLKTGPSQTGKLLLTVGTPEIHAQVLAQRDDVERPLGDTEVEGIVTSVWSLVGDSAGQALAKLPLPELAGIHLGAPAVTGKSGYLVADIALK
jgi:hypothetical protein